MHGLAQIKNKRNSIFCNKNNNIPNVIPQVGSREGRVYIPWDLERLFSIDTRLKKNQIKREIIEVKKS